MSTPDVSTRNGLTPYLSPTKCQLTNCLKKHFDTFSFICAISKTKAANFFGTKTLLGIYDVLIQKAKFFPIGMEKK